MLTFDQYQPDDGEAAPSDFALSVLPLTQALRRRRKTGFADTVELGDGSVLPPARDAAASVPASPMEQARVLPQAAAAQRANFGGLVAGYDTKLADYQKQMEALNQDPDYSGLAAQARARGGEGVAMLGASLAAGMGPRDMAHLQPSLAAQSAHMMQPQKIEGGEVDVSGQVRIDPGYKRQKQIETMRTAMQHLEQQKLAAVTAEEKYRIEEQQNRMLDAFHNATLEATRQANADRAANARALIELKSGDKTLGDKDRFIVEDRMHGEFQNESKNVITGIMAARQMKALPTERPWNPIEQQTAVVLLNKIIDPPSVVREGEFDRVANAQGWYEKAGMLKARILHGDILSPELMKEISNMGTAYEASSVKAINDIAGSYVERSRRRNVDPQAVVGQWMPSDAPKPPQVPQGPPANAALQATKTVGGVNYVKVNGQWYSQ